jgi:hypothetical protein
MTAEFRKWDVLLTGLMSRFLSIWMAGCSIKVHRRAKLDARDFGTRTRMPSVEVQSRPKSQAYPPPSMQERIYGA